MAIFGTSDSQNVLEAINKSQAVIEFEMDGTIRTANQNFLRVLGYELHEIVGKHHRIFVDPVEVTSPAYQDFWAQLRGGEYDSRQYKRLTKSGKEVWIEASYNPVMRGGKPYKVVKFATDVTAQKLKAAEDGGKYDAISRAQAVIEFNPQGEILYANKNFLQALGYTSDDIRGQHHAMFCEPTYTQSSEYREFWKKLASGEFVADEFLRFGKGGKKVYIQASYNPIFDMNGKVFKVVKFATDVTQRVNDVAELADGLQALSEGDLTREISRPFLPALDRLRSDFNATAQKLRGTLNKILQNAGAIAAASQQIQSASNELARRTEQQAASVEETAAALEEITTTVADSSQRAQDAGQLVRQTKTNAERSGQVVTEAVSAMGKIEQSAGEIASIIGVIDEIAFQTNLLALNAGVEAARAGDAGKGFAVVAQEVRELAQRSAKAAKEIKTLINTSNSHVKQGVMLVGDTGKALQEIAEQVALVDNNVSAIVEASREQATGIREINLAVNTMDQGTQQNASMVEETSAAAHGLASEAERLFTLIGQFKTGPSNGAASPSSAARPAGSPVERLTLKVANAFDGNARRKPDDGWENF